jgi:YHS domain-containing protein
MFFSIEEVKTMRRVGLWTIALMMLGAAGAQAAKDCCSSGSHAQETKQCPTCSARGEVARILANAKQPADWVKVHDGILWVVQGRNEEDGKAIQKQLDALAKAMKDENAPLCSDCQMQRSILRSLDWEIVKTRRGGILIATSSDATTVTMLHEYADEQQRMQQAAPATKPPVQPAPKAEPATQGGTKEFAGKGDGITTCPVSGEPVNKDIWAEIKGRKVYFCCANCRAKALKDPDKYIR